MSPLGSGPLETWRMSLLRVEREPRTQRMADLANEKARLHRIQPITWLDCSFRFFLWLGLQPISSLQLKPPFPCLHMLRKLEVWTSHAQFHLFILSPYSLFFSLSIFWKSDLGVWTYSFSRGGRIPLCQKMHFCLGSKSLSLWCLPGIRVCVGCSMAEGLACQRL